VSNIYVKGHFIQKLSSEHTDTHRRSTALPGPQNDQ